MKLILVLIILVIVSIILVVQYTFNNSILRERKDENKAIEVLKNRGIYNEELKRLIDKSNYEELECISKEGYKLKGYYYEKHKNGDKGVILVHGYTANHFVHLPFIKMFFNEGFNVLLIDVRSHGMSEGKYATYGVYEKEDLALWVKILKNKLKNNAFVGLHGQSMGAATSLMYGGYKKDIDFIIADCGYSSGKEILKYQIKEKAKIPFFPLYQLLNIKTKILCKFDFNKVSPIEDIKDIDIPIFFVHGTKDETVPVRMSEEMFKLRNKEFDKILIVEGAIHMNCYDMCKDKYISELHEFLQLAKKLKEKSDD